jgi:hypothetical protein
MFWTLLFNGAIASPPAGVVALDHVQPVQIEDAFVYEWNAERRQIQTATILVVEVVPGTAQTRQTATPVLYVGSTPAARVHPGETDHHLVVFVPGHPDLSRTPIFWGPDTLPEQVTAQMGTESTQNIAGQPFSLAATHAATRPLIQLSDQGALYGHMASLIDEYAPSDHRFSTSIRVTLQP